MSRKLAQPTLPHQPLEAAYNAMVDSGTLREDLKQHRVVTLLDHRLALLSSPRKKTGGVGLFKKKQPDNNPTQGLYIHGSVGRGKSLLMDLFFHHAPLENKRRVHFHAFMLEVHGRLHACKDRKKKGDDLLGVAKDIARESALLCFDEFQVNDIADAMILSRLFTALFNEGVTVVATSNRAPDDLYRDGLQRQRFLPFIDLLKQKLTIHCLDGDLDYRTQHLSRLATTYHTPLGTQADRFLATVFADLTQNATPEATTLQLKGRTLKAPKTHGDIAWFTFAELCARPLGAEDYLELAEQFTTLLLQDIPRLSAEKRNEAKRFVTLIDALYEHRTKLICTAEVTPEKLYPQGDGSFEFERTTSRLMEMQSESYFHRAHQN